MNSRTAFDLAKAGLPHRISGPLVEGERGSAGSTNCIRSGQRLFATGLNPHREEQSPWTEAMVSQRQIFRGPGSRFERHPDRTGVGRTAAEDWQQGGAARCGR